jgi:hypothetical protein
MDEQLNRLKNEKLAGNPTFKLSADADAFRDPDFRTC